MGRGARGCGASNRTRLLWEASPCAICSTSPREGDDAPSVPAPDTTPRTSGGTERAATPW